MKNCWATITLLCVVLLFACEQNQSSSTTNDNSNSEKQKVVEAKGDWGNKMCPVMEEKIDPKEKVTSVYEGKTVNFCCEKCVEKFNENPKKYHEKLVQFSKADSHEGHSHEGHSHEGHSHE